MRLRKVVLSFSVCPSHHIPGPVGGGWVGVVDFLGFVRSPGALRGNLGETLQGSAPNAAGVVPDVLIVHLTVVLVLNTRN